MLSHDRQNIATDIFAKIPFFFISVNVINGESHRFMNILLCLEVIYEPTFLNKNLIIGKKKPSGL